MDRSTGNWILFFLVAIYCRLDHVSLNDMLWKGLLIVFWCVALFIGWNVVKTVHEVVCGIYNGGRS